MSASTRNEDYRSAIPDEYFRYCLTKKICCSVRLRIVKAFEGDSKKRKMNKEKVLYKAECRVRKIELARMSKAERNEEKEEIRQRWKELCMCNPMSTGFRVFDGYRGVCTNSVTTVYGHYGSGKTLFVMNIVADLLKENKRCIFISMDKSKDEVMLLLACIIAEIDPRGVKDGTLNDIEKSKFHNAVEWLKTKKIDVYHGHFTLSDVYRIVSGFFESCTIPELLVVDEIPEIIPIGDGFGLDLFNYIANHITAVIITASIGRRIPTMIKNKELFKVSDTIVKLQKTRLTQKAERLMESEHQGTLDDTVLKIVKNRNGLKGMLNLKQGKVKFFERANIRKYKIVGR